MRTLLLSLALLAFAAPAFANCPGHVTASDTGKSGTVTTTSTQTPTTDKKGG